MKSRRFSEKLNVTIIKNRGKTIYEILGKRILDIIVSVIILIATSPLMVLVAVAIRLDSKGPILFQQQRSGIDGKVFMLKKFRSMTANNNVYDASQKDEVTRIGKFIRRTSIDEIPQLVNVLNGEMSLIGPRPWLPEYFENMNEIQRMRYSVRPGLTGLAQARGRNALGIIEKINCDLEYVQKVSLVGDFKIVFLTLKTMLDESSLDIGKFGIQEEIEFLKRQNRTY
ncbi:sugar transferase [Corynebacterium callunae]|uniref:sugar transferase n=1 Tax=Corynebacterium callunae TaxID=1721 RepID=UPI003981D164